MIHFTVPEYRISIDQLRPGVFIRLENTGWFDHPFLFNSFKIKDEEQITLLRQSKISEVTCVPEKCDVLPHRLEGKKTPPSPAPSTVSQKTIDRMWEIKKERSLRLKQKKQRIAECEEKFSTCIQNFDNILKGLLGGSKHAANDVVQFVDRLASHFLVDRESTLHLMNVMGHEEVTYSHPMNVAILCMMVGREAGLDADEMKILGLGALLHDIGKYRIPKKLLKKRGELTKPEQELLQQHCQLGATLLEQIDTLPSRVTHIVAQHHEYLNGSGYPQGLKGDSIDELARIVAIANTYDNHCNHVEIEQTLTPYLALSYMFGQQKHLFDVECLALFIRCLGIYPPGTVVELSNGATGMVMSVNPMNQLNPSVVLYDPNVPKKEALIVDLAEETDLRVEKSIRISHLPPEVHDYLSPRTKITYFIEPNGS